MRKLLRSLLIILLALITGGVLTGTWSGRSYHPQNDPRVMAKLAPWVIEKTAAGATSDFLVVLDEQADLSGAAELASKEARGRYVYETLLAHARRTQASLLDWLNARGVEHQPFYIVNTILVKGDRDLAVMLAARPEVGRIEGNPVLTGISPVDQSGEAESRRTAEVEGFELGIGFIRAPEVWAAGYTGQGIVIGGQDTGIKWDHPALKSRYRGWDGTTASHDYNWHDSIHSGGGECGADTSVPCDDDNHGTHTIGTAVGTDGGSNQIGVAPGAKFIGCRNMDRGNGTPATYLECFEFFLAPYPVGGTVAQGDPGRAPDLTVNSWSCPPAEGCAVDTLRAAVEAQRAAGIMTIVAAGNSGLAGCSTVSDPPALYDASYSVGAIRSSTGLLASFSSRGPVAIDGSLRVKPDITAPGVGVRSAMRTGGYGVLDGTSMATPHVAGAVALLWSAFPHLRGQIEVTEALLNESAVRINTTSCSSTGIPNTLYGYGRLDIKAAFDLASGRFFSISGRVDGGSGGFNRTTIVFSRVSGSGAIPNPVVVDRDGAWTQVGFEMGTVYRATPFRLRTIFTPSHQDVSIANSQLRFTPVARGFRILD